MKEQKYEIQRETIQAREEEKGHLVIWHFALVLFVHLQTAAGGLVNALFHHWREATLMLVCCETKFGPTSC